MLFKQIINDNSETKESNHEQISETLMLKCFEQRIPTTIPVAELSKVRVCGRLLAGIVSSNSSEGIDVCLLCVLCVVR